METCSVALDEKAKRMRDLLSSFYSPDPFFTRANSSKYASLDAINSSSFDSDQYMHLLTQKSNLEELLQRHVEMAAEVKNLDTDLQMLVYENYNKFISATDAIKRMKNNIMGMETNMEQLLEKIKSVQYKSDVINTSLLEKREHIEKLHQTCNLLHKVQFTYDLPATLWNCIKSEAYTDAIRFYTGALPIFKAYGDSSFYDCNKASEEAIATIIEKLKGKLFSSCESIQARADAVVLLKQLDFPIDGLQALLFAKLEQYVEELQLTILETSNALEDLHCLSEQGNLQESILVAHHASVREFTDAIQSYLAIFSQSESELNKLVRGLIFKIFKFIEQLAKKRISVAHFLTIIRVAWRDVLLMDEVLHDASLPSLSLEVSQAAIKQFVTYTFSCLLHDISDSVMIVHFNHKEVTREHVLLTIFDAGRNAVLQGSLSVVMGFRQLINDNLELLINLKDFIIDWIQGGFQDFFKSLNFSFLTLCEKGRCCDEEKVLKGEMTIINYFPGLVLVLSELSIFIEQNVIPRITEEMASFFPGCGIHGFENGPTFAPGEICHIFRSAGEEFLHHYVVMRTGKTSILLQKRFTSLKILKHMEPSEVHVIVDLLLQEMENIRSDAKQVLPRGIPHRHHCTEGSESTTSSFCISLRDETSHPNTHQRARSQLLETHLAKLFKEKVVIFTKIEHTQESVLASILKLYLKSLLEFVRLQTFDHGGFQQMQVDVQFLKNSLKEFVDDLAVDFLLDEVVVGAAERCIDSIPLDPAVLEGLIT